jgi:hypothetical protein
MQKWEYIEVTAPMREDGKAVHNYSNGTEALPETMASSLYDYLNKLGNEGWELVNFAFYPNRTAFYYFKRPIE